MTFDDLLEDHKGQLGKTAQRFTAPDDADFRRHLRRAAQRMTLKDPLWKLVDIPLSVGQSRYPAPADLLACPLSDWGRSANSGCTNPWDDHFVGFAPLLTVERGDSGPILQLSSPVTGLMLTAWGATLRLRYLAAHEISDEQLTISPGTSHLVLLAALIEAMRELATEMTVIQIQKGISGLPTAGTPAYLYEKLSQEFDRA